MDEVGVSMSDSTVRVVTARSFVRKSFRIQGLHTTVVLATRAVGDFCPPLIIMQGGDATCLPPPLLQSTKFWCAFSDTGYIVTDIFRAWFRHFIQHLKEIGRHGQPTLLTLDNHASHLDADILQTAKHNNIFVVACPSQLTCVVQVNDLGPNKSFKEYFRKELAQVVTANVAINPTVMAEVIMAAFNTERHDYRNSITGSFRRVGLYPFDPSVVNEMIEREQPGSTGDPEHDRRIKQITEDVLQILANNATLSHHFRKQSQKKTIDKEFALDTSTATILTNHDIIVMLSLGERLTNTKKIKDVADFREAAIHQWGLRESDVLKGPGKYKTRPQIMEMIKEKARKQKNTLIQRAERRIANITWEAPQPHPQRARRPPQLPDDCIYQPIRS